VRGQVAIGRGRLWPLCEAYLAYSVRSPRTTVVPITSLWFIPGDTLHAGRFSSRTVDVVPLGAPGGIPTPLSSAARRIDHTTSRMASLGWRILLDARPPVHAHVVFCVPGRPCCLVFDCRLSRPAGGDPLTHSIGTEFTRSMQSRTEDWEILRRARLGSRHAQTRAPPRSHREHPALGGAQALV
jgi:hypothetical protein